METPSHMTWKSYSTSVLLAACSALVLSGCVKERSGATGWAEVLGFTDGLLLGRDEGWLLGRELGFIEGPADGQSLTDGSSDG